MAGQLTSDGEVEIVMDRNTPSLFMRVCHLCKISLGFMSKVMANFYYDKKVKTLGNFETTLLVNV